MTNKDPKQAEHTGKPHLPAHTPTPWYIERGYSVFGKTLKIPFFRHIASTGGIDNPAAVADAAFIVRAVNAHEELIGIVRFDAQLIHEKHNHPGKSFTTCDDPYCVTRRNAIAKAEGR